MLAFAATLDPLRMANWLSGRTLYEWTLMSPDGQPVKAVNGVSIAVDGSFNDKFGESTRANVAGSSRIPSLLVMASYNTGGLVTSEIVASLRRAARFVTTIGGVDDGTFILAQAGLLDGYTATAHWEYLDAYIERFPKIAFTQDLFVIDRNRFTAAGGTAGLDMMLTQIRATHGQELAAKAADEFVYSRIRDSRDAQRMPLRRRLATSNPRLIKAVEAMEAHTDNPRPMRFFAETAGVTVREMERMFQRWLKMPPGTYYRGMRLDKARTLLQQTDMTIFEVSIACGFPSPAHFSRSYRARFGRSPRADRTT